MLIAKHFQTLPSARCILELPGKICCFWLERSACIFADEYTNIFKHKEGAIHRLTLGMFIFDRQNRKHNPRCTSTCKGRAASLKPTKLHWDKQKKKIKKKKITSWPCRKLTSLEGTGKQCVLGQESAEFGWCRPFRSRVALVFASGHLRSHRRAPRLCKSTACFLRMTEVAKVAIKISCYSDATWFLIAEEMGTETTERACWH